MGWHYRFFEQNFGFHGVFSADEWPIGLTSKIISGVRQMA
jgi:hypothetical protein